VLDIGRLSPGATEYYIAEVATSAEDYYTGRGEFPGRWLGSLAAELGLSGRVDPNHFRSILNGKDPLTGEYLMTARGSASRASKRRNDSSVPAQLADGVDSLRAAAHLGVSGRYVRRLLAEGERYRVRLERSCETEVVPEPSAYLLGEKTEGNGQAGSDAWRVEREELERFAGTRRHVKARPGYDLTLRPPKSVSVLWALASDDRRRVIRRAHAEAVDEVVRYYETNAVFARQGGGARRLVPTAGIVAAAFDHRTSRAGDPLLHTHVVTANMTCVEGWATKTRWRAVAGAGLYEHARAAGHLYQAHLRHLLAVRLGLQFTPVINGHAEVQGVPYEVVQAFSKRRTEIKDVLAESTHSSARAAQIATLDTRQAKEYGVDAETLEARWRAEADELGFHAEEVEACFERRGPEPVVRDVLNRLTSVLAGRHGLTERAATFSRTDAIEAVASALGASAPARDICRYADEFLACDQVVLVDRFAPDPTAVQASTDRVVSADGSVRRSPTQKLYTTRELVEVEARLLAWGEVGEPLSARVGGQTVEEVLARRPELSAEQRRMVRAACTGAEFMQPIAGRPGAGKTYAIEAVVTAHVVAGVPIIGCAVSAAAAAELERAGGFARSTRTGAATVARLLVELDTPRVGGLPHGAVVVIDEASMIGSRDLERLAVHARAASGALFLVGDPDQHGSVDVGGVFRRLCLMRGSELVTLVDNNRQHDHVERLAIAEYRDGHVADALGRYDDAGKVVRSSTAGESFDAIVADWYAARLCGRADPMIAGPNSTRRALNDRARVLLKANDELRGDPLVVAGRESMVGDGVVARRNDRRLRSPHSRDFVKNGSTGTVVEVVDRDVVVAFDREGEIRVPSDYLVAGHLEHGYARTTYGVQGTTHDVARYHPTDMSSFEEGYVALTRARRAAHIYVVDGAPTPSEDNLRHTPDASQSLGLSEVTTALSRRRSSRMAADFATGLSTVAGMLDRFGLRELTERRRQLERVIDGAPHDANADIEQAEIARQTIRARRRIWTAVATEATPLQYQRARDAIAALHSAYVHATARLERALSQQAQRTSWLEEHAEVVAKYTMLRRAERARESQVRMLAPHSAAASAEPSTQRERLVWRRALEAIAVRQARIPTDVQPAKEPYDDVHISEMT
jgi:conjugative relaxase-like TrwC/TraI family protein